MYACTQTPHMCCIAAVHKQYRATKRAESTDFQTRFEAPKTRESELQVTHLQAVLCCFLAACFVRETLRLGPGSVSDLSHGLCLRHCVCAHVASCWFEATGAVSKETFGYSSMWLGVRWPCRQSSLRFWRQTSIDESPPQFMLSCKSSVLETQ